MVAVDPFVGFLPPPGPFQSIRRHHFALRNEAARTGELDHAFSKAQHTLRRTRMSAKDRPPEISNAKLWAGLSLDSAVLVSAQFLASSDEVHAVWSQRDVIASRKRLFSTTYTLSKNNRFVASPPVEVQDPSAAQCYFSPSRKKFLKFSSKNGNLDGDSGSLMAEVWTVGGGLDRCWEIGPTLHGSVYTDEWFGSVAWSPDESMAAYIADRPKPNPIDKPEDPHEAWTLPLGHKFHERARDPFGEAYANKRSPTLFIADTNEGRSHAVFDDSSSKGELYIGEPQWSPDGKFIAATMRHTSYFGTDFHLQEEGFLSTDLGLRYCYNRHSAIVVFSAPQSPDLLESFPLQMRTVSSETSAEDFCCNSPRFSLDSAELIYLSAPRFSTVDARGRALPHNTTKVLRAVRINDLEASEPRTLIGVPSDPSHRDFPGLYLHALPEDPWLSNTSIVFSSMWGSVNKPLSKTFGQNADGCVEPSTKSLISDLSAAIAASQPENGDGINLTRYSLTILDKIDNVLLVSGSNPASPSQLFSVRLDDGYNFVTKTLPVSVLSTRAKDLQDNIQDFQTFDLVASSFPDENFSGCAKQFVAGEHEPSERFQVTILLPNSSAGKSPLVVFPHGGPHVSTLNGYSQGVMSLLKRRFAVMYVNYRGSLGLGQKSLETLPGNVGRQEVNEIVQATRWALSQADFCLDKNRVGFLGGSHSGFIGAHTSLIPGLFKRTVLRNPVVNIATMVGATDIPDWCFCEAGLSCKNESGVPLAADADQMRVMYEHSPVSKVKPLASSEKPGPTLLQVGGSDRRVPPQQSLEWKRIMTQAYGSDSIVIRWYPNSGHAIDEVPNGDDSWVHALDFLCEL